MRLVIDELAADHRRHLIDAVGKQEAAIEDRDLALGFRHIGAVHIDSPAHCDSLG